MNEMDSLHSQILEFKPRKSDIRRAKLVDALIECIGTDGIDSVTFDSIGKRVKMARSHVIYYFPNREDMIEAAIRYVCLSGQTYVIKKAEAIADWRERLLASLEANFDWIKEKPHHGSVMALFFYQSSFKKRYRKLHTEVRDMGAKRIEAHLDLAPKEFRKSVLSNSELASQIQAVITGGLIEAFSTDHIKQFDKVKQSTLKFIESLLPSK